MFDSHCSSKRPVSLNDDIVLFAKIRDSSLRVERMDFDLVDGWLDFWLRIEEFLQLE
jgi:hypothetical protein